MMLDAPGPPFIQMMLGVTSAGTKIPNLFNAILLPRVLGFRLEYMSSTVDDINPAFLMVLKVMQDLYIIRSSSYTLTP